MNESNAVKYIQILKFDFTKFENLCSSNHTIVKMHSQAEDQEKWFDIQKTNK